MGACGRYRRQGILIFAAAASVFSSSLLWAEDEVFDRQVVRQPVEEGVEIVAVREFDERGWLTWHALEIDHTQPHLSFDALAGHERLTKLEALSDIASRQGAIGAINGDFFHINRTNAPIGIHIQSGELFKSPPAHPHWATGFSEKRGRGEPFIGRVTFWGRLLADEAEWELEGWNLPTPAADGIVLYNHRWSDTAPGGNSADLAGQTGLVHVLLDEQNCVLDVLQEEEGPSIPPGGAVLLGRGEGGRWLQRHLKTGQQLGIEYGIDPQHLKAAIGGNPLLLENGSIVVPVGGDIHPRSAIGFSRDRTWFVVVEGRARMSRGVTLHELATLLRDLGAENALNLDGGGSSTLLARTSGAGSALLQNVPSDGGERPVPNGLGLFSSSQTGPMINLTFQKPSSQGIYRLEDQEVRLAPHSLYRPALVATDAHVNPVAIDVASIQWQVEPSELGELESPGIFRAAKPGKGILRATTADSKSPRQEAILPIRVIGEPVALQLEPREMALSAGQDVEVHVSAVDAKGYRAPLAWENLAWEIRGEIGELSDGRFLAREEPGSGALFVRFGDVTEVAPVGIGERPVEVANFENLDEWATAAVPEMSTSALSAADHKPHTRTRAKALRLEYSFTGTTRVRAAYVRPQDGPMQLAGRPLRLGLWVYGDGKEAWLRAQMLDAHGTMRPIDFARNVDWTGWQYVEAEVPAGTDYPISIRSIYIVETRPDAQYDGAIYLDELLAVSAPDLDPALLAGKKPMRDPANRPEQIDPTRDDHFRFVVFGDSKIEADSPDSPGVRILQALIDQINQENVPFTLFTGDLIENDTGSNYSFGKALLDRLNMPYHVAVANHEIAGSHDFERYREFFGPTYYSFAHRNAEFIVLNTAKPAGPRASEPEQWVWFRHQLEKSNLQNLFIMTHTPLIDPLPGARTCWTDPAEIELFQNLLTEAAEAGKNVYAFHGHVHGFDRRVFDGVQYLTTAGAGSPLYLPPDRGGFFHYIVVTVKGEDVTYQVIPLLESIDLPASVEVSAGASLELTPFGVAPDNLVRFPLAYPAAVEWSSDDPGTVKVDAPTGTLTGLAPGKATVTIRSGGVTANVQVRVVEP